mmetsp:Transcript_76658/g.175818  ORF Transcript_76658/g.175818 Transcript_76658/m.175818 type:complete len:159 (+) Transcript_76658:115-591(+)
MKLSGKPALKNPRVVMPLIVTMWFCPWFFLVNWEQSQAVVSQHVVTASVMVATVLAHAEDRMETWWWIGLLAAQIVNCVGMLGGAVWPFSSFGNGSLIAQLARGCKSGAWCNDGWYAFLMILAFVEIFLVVVVLFQTFKTAANLNAARLLETIPDEPA